MRFYRIALLAVLTAALVVAGLVVAFAALDDGTVGDSMSDATECSVTPNPNAGVRFVDCLEQ